MDTYLKMLTKIVVLENNCIQQEWFLKIAVSQTVQFVYKEHLAINANKVFMFAVHRVGMSVRSVINLIVRNV